MKVIVVVGKANADDEANRIIDRFWERAIMVKAVLMRHLGFYARDILVLTSDGSAGSSVRLQKQLETALMGHRDEDVCLFYAGHGMEDGWALSGIRDNESLSYSDLGLLLAQHHGNLILVNYCCFAGAAVAAFSHKAGEWLLIAAMPADRSDAAYRFCAYVMRSWMQRSFFDPHASSESDLYVPPVLGNESLQKLLFDRSQRRIAYEQ